MFRKLEVISYSGTLLISFAVLLEHFIDFGAISFVLKLLLFVSLLVFAYLLRQRFIKEKNSSEEKEIKKSNVQKLVDEYKCKVDPT